MSPEGREIVAGLLTVLLVVIAIRVQPAIHTWRAQRRLLRAFRLQLDTTHPVDACQCPSGEPPPR